jgi:hypothetical protein
MRMLGQLNRLVQRITRFPEPPPESNLAVVANNLHAAPELDRAPSILDPHTDPEFRSAENHGYEIHRSLQNRYKWQLFHNMAALALFWTCAKPSSQPLSAERDWIEGDVIRMFR